MDLLIGVLADSLMDTAKLVPFLFVTYLAMEALEHGTADRMRRVVSRAGAAGPVVGGLLGALPQCGFSAMASTLYSARVVTAGTLVAVILSTSDEMLPVFLANQVPAARLVSIVASKVAIGVVVGLLVDAALGLAHRTGDGRTHIHELCEREHCHCDDAADGEAVVGGRGGDEACGHCHPHVGGRRAVVRSALVHTVQVSAFILVITFVLGAAISLVGEGAFASFISVHPTRAVFLSALVGLIPNCGASVVISELYLTGALGAGAMMAGLLVAGGVGLLVLYRTNTNAWQNCAITALLYAVGVACGLAINLLGITF